MDAVVHEDAVTLGADRLHVARAGEGPPIVLLHGWPVTWRHWRRVIPGLAADHLVLAPDLPGLGGSTNAGGDYDTASLARLVLRALDRLGVEKFVVGGHDWGGSVAYATAALARDRVTALVVEEELLPGFRADPDGLAGGTYPVWHVEMLKLPELPEALLRGREHHLYDYFWGLAAPGSAFSQELRDEYAAAYSGPGALWAGLAFYRAAARSAEANRRFAESPLEIPVLAIGGDRAIGGGVETSLCNVAPDVEGHVVKECGHYPATEHPDEWLRLVRGFLT